MPPKITQAQTALNAGEWSPLLWTRVDHEKYRQSARILENFLVLPYGGIYRRPGFECICPAKDQDKPARLVPFQFSVTDSYVLEFYENGIRVFKDGTCKICPGQPDSEMVIPTPYSAEDLNELQFAQLNDIVYIIHEDYPPHRLERYNDCDWKLVEVVWTFPPLCPENDDEACTITPTATTPGKNGTLTASKATFTPDQVGGYFELCCERENNDFEVKIGLGSAATSSVLVVYGSWDLATSGTWTGRLCVEKYNRDTGLWEIIYQKDVIEDRNLSFGDSEDCREEYRVSIKDIPADPAAVPPFPLTPPSSTGATPAFATLTAGGGKICGIVRITGYNSPTSVTYDVVKPIDETKATSLWSESAWSEKKGYPRSVTFHEERLILGGTRSAPQTLWGSTIDDYENFQLGTQDDDSWAFTLAARLNETIQWLESQRDLMIGTTTSEWAFGSGVRGESISPSRRRAQRFTSFGSAYRQSTLVNDSVFHVQRGCRKIRETSFDINSDGYVSNDVTIFSEHVTRGGVIQTAYQQNRDSIYWIVNGCGELAGLTYEKEQGVSGWHRHTTQGKFEGVTVIYGDDDVDGITGEVNKSEQDELWVTVKRECKDADGNTITKRFIERQRPEHYRTVDECDQENYFYVDCGRTQKTDEETSIMTGLEDLEGCEVTIFADGACAGVARVADGQITLPNDKTAKCITAGLSYASVFQSQGIELVVNNGTGMSRYKQTSEVAIWVWKSLLGEVGGHIDMEEKQTCKTQKHRPDKDWNCIKCPEGVTVLGEAPKPYSGWTCTPIDSERTKDGVITIRQTQPLPLAILSLVVKFQQTGDES